MRRVVRVGNRLLPFTSRWIGKAYINISNRPMIQYVSETMGENLVGVEVGVREGRHAKVALEKLSLKTLYLVDPYLPYEESVRKGVDMGKIKEKAHSTLKSPKIVWVEQPSGLAYKTVEDGVDFVYIDASHDTKNVTMDCHLWYSKVRNGGILGGHDYNGIHKALRFAVNCFCKEKKEKLKVKNNDWWIVKKEKLI